MTSQSNSITFHFGLLRLVHSGIEDSVLCILKLQPYFVFRAHLSLLLPQPPPPGRLAHHVLAAQGGVCSVALCRTPCPPSAGSGSVVSLGDRGSRCLCNLSMGKWPLLRLSPGAERLLLPSLRGLASPPPFSYISWPVPSCSFLQVLLICVTL